MWQYERRLTPLMGNTNQMNEGEIIHFLDIGYFRPPCTVFNQVREVFRTGNTGLNSNNFPDLLIEQNPKQKFALHLSGGFDSSILAKLYDREDALYIHIGSKELPKAKALTDTLKSSTYP